MKEGSRTLGKSSLLSLSGRLEVTITKLLGKRKTKLFCKKYEALVTGKFNNKHECLKPKRIYQKKGEARPTVIFCPNLMTLKGSPFYKEHEDIIYEGLEEVYLIEHEFKHKPKLLPAQIETRAKEKNLDVIDKSARNIQSIKKAYHDLTGSV